MRARSREILKGCFVISILLGLAAAPALAGFIDFEDGEDGVPIRSTIPGLEFTTTEGYDWVYGDWRTGNYCGPYPHNPNPMSCGELYYSNGNFFAWLGENQGKGIISFTAAYATYFTIGYSAYYGLYLEAYDSENNLLDNDYGPPNTNTGRLDFLHVEGPGMAYVVIHDTGNYWLVDDLETDAIQECTTDAECDDGVFCNGQEKCISYATLPMRLSVPTTACSATARSSATKRRTSAGTPAIRAKRARSAMKKRTPANRPGKRSWARDRWPAAADARFDRRAGIDDLEIRTLQ